MNVDVGLTVPSFTGPLGRHFGPFSITFGDTETNIGDTGITPITLGWHSGNFYWNAGLCIFAPTGKYDKRDLANTSLNHWAVIPTFAITYFDAKANWQVSGAFAYAVNFENPETGLHEWRSLPLRRLDHQEFRAAWDRCRRLRHDPDHT